MDWTHKLASESGATLLGEKAVPPVEPRASTQHEAVTAFLVVLNKNGSIQYFPDVNYGQNLVLERFPAVEEMAMAAHHVVDDINAHRAAAATQSRMAALGAAMAEQQATAQTVASLGDIRKGR